MALNYVGNPLLFRMSFVDEVTGEPTSPTSINLRYTTPDGKTTTGIPFPNLTEDSPGEWHYVLQTTGFIHGDYVTELSCAGALIAVSPPETFTLAAPKVPGL